MSVSIPTGAGLGSGISLNAAIPKVPVFVSTSNFFDRAAVNAALSAMERKGLTGASLLVRRTAQKSITKVGGARPKLRILSEYRGATLKNLLTHKFVTDRTKDKIRQRLYELKFRPASPPGTPPHTHVPSSHMLGFRRNLYNSYDRSTQSAVVGPTKKGDLWDIPRLHEFGGTQVMQGWAWIPRWRSSYSTGIIGYWRVGRSPRNRNRWEQTQFRETARYPARPYMRPAMLNAVKSGKIPKEFSNRFRVGGL